MLEMVDKVSGNMGYIGTDPGRLYRMGPRIKTAVISGTPPLTLENGIGKPLKGLTIYGKSVQKQYQGYQLIPLGLKDTDGNVLTMPYTRDGITVTMTEDGKGFSVRGTNTASSYANFYITTPNELNLDAGTYTRSGKGFTKDIMMISGGGSSNGGVLQYNQASSDFSLTETVEAGKSGNHILRVSENATVDTTVYYQLEKGSAAHDFEPYTGGQPSPSPDYPQEIVNTGNDGSVNVDVRGKNLVKSYQNIKTAAKYNSVLMAEIDELMPDTKYALSMTIADKNEVYVNENLAGFIKIVGDGTRKQVIIKTLPNISKKDSGQYMKEKGWILLKNTESNTVVSDIKDVQLELGPTITAYEPYRTPQSMSIPTPNGLPGIPVTSGGNYTDSSGQQWICDEIDFARGVYVQRIKMLDLIKASGFDNNGVWHINTESLGAGTEYVPIPWKSKTKKIYCNIFPVQMTNYSLDNNNNNTIYYSSTGDTISLLSSLFRAEGETYASKDDFKTWLTKHPTYLYVLIEPIETPLTSDQLAAYKQLHTYKGTTVVDNDAGAGMKVSYST